MSKPKKAKEIASSERELRVALLWNQTIVAEEQLAVPAKVGLGEGELFPLPEGLTTAKSIAVLRPAKNGYELMPSLALGGSIWLGGHRQDVSVLTQSGRSVPLGPEDYGVLTLGPVALFFQYVRPAKAPPKAGIRLDPALVASIGLAFFLTFVTFVIGYLNLREHPYVVDPLALDTERIAQYLVEPPAPEPESTRSGDEVEDQGLRGREEVGGEAAEGPEGRVGRQEATQENTHIEGEVRDQVSQRVRSMGLLGALSGGSNGNAIAAALETPNVSDILAGMGAGPTVIGRGSGGMGLRGVGSGGGGDGPGNLFGAGRVGTGAGAGSGGGVGAGRGGLGASGRARQEVQVQVRLGSARPSNGYLSAEQINRVVRRSASAIRYCYETQLQRQPTLHGQITIAWTITLSGSVSGPRVGRSSMHNSSVEGCVVRVVGRMRFPQPDGGPVQVSYPFDFGS